MAIEITRTGKNDLILETPVMTAAGALGYGEAYRSIVNYDKLGAIVTTPISYDPRSAANGTRAVPLDSGVLLHTGLPNPGLNKVLRQHRNLWKALTLPIIVHLIADNDEKIRKAAARLDDEDAVKGIELGLNDDIEWKDAARLVGSAVTKTEKPVIARLPLSDAYEIAAHVADAGAAAVVVAAPPRGKVRDPLTGKFIEGRIYGPLVKPMALNMIERIARRIGIPVIGAGGINSPQDARDYLDTGAVAVQVDSIIWRSPTELEVISRDLGGYIVTRESQALPDEWHRGMGDTEKEQQKQAGRG